MVCEPSYYQFGCRISKMLVPKKQDFFPRINKLKKKKEIKLFYGWTFIEKYQYYALKVDLICQNHRNFKLFFHSFKKINLGDHLLLKTLFPSFNFWTTLFSKILPNFWRTVIHCKYKNGLRTLAESLVKWPAVISQIFWNWMSLPYKTRFQQNN